ncbi:MAG: hypothetical protein ACK4I8_12045, partial [Armatimonadota bacterium]
MKPRWRNWQWVVGVVVTVIAVGALADWAMRYFVLRINAQAINLSVNRVAQQMDNFFEFAARNLTFQRTLSVFEDLFNPQRRSLLLHQSGAWIDEMRKSASADFWVVLDESNRIAVSLPLGTDKPSWRPIWKAPLKNYPCNVALLAGTNS